MRVDRRAIGKVALDFATLMRTQARSDPHVLSRLKY